MKTDSPKSKRGITWAFALPIITGLIAAYIYQQANGSLTPEQIALGSTPSGSVTILSNAEATDAQMLVSYESSSGTGGAIDRIRLQGTLWYDTSAGQDAGDLMLLLTGTAQVNESSVESPEALTVATSYSLNPNATFERASAGCEFASGSAQAVVLRTFGVREDRDAETGVAQAGLRPVDISMTAQLRNPISGVSSGAESLVTLPRLATTFHTEGSQGLDRYRSFAGPVCPLRLPKLTNDVGDHSGEQWSGFLNKNTMILSVRAPDLSAASRLTYATPSTDGPSEIGWTNVDRGTDFIASYETVSQDKLSQQAGWTFIAGAGAGAAGGGLYEWARQRLATPAASPRADRSAPATARPSRPRRPHLNGSTAARRPPRRRVAGRARRANPPG